MGYALTSLFFAVWAEIFVGLLLTIVPLTNLVAGRAMDVSVQFFIGRGVSARLYRDTVALPFVYALIGGACIDRLSRSLYYSATDKSGFRILANSGFVCRGWSGFANRI